MKSLWNWIVSFFTKAAPAPKPMPVANPVPAPSVGSIASGSTTGANVPPKQTWDGTSEVPGVDTAHYQDAMTAADWLSLFAKGFRWMYPKAVDGANGPDSYFAESKILAKAAGFLCFAGYCFFRFDQDPIAQAEALVKVTGGVKSGELPCVIDCEWDNASKDPGYHDRDHGGTRQLIDGPGEEKLYACLCKVQELTGITPWLYGSTGFLIFKSPARFARFPFIVANYSAKTPDGKVPLPLPWVQETARQYSGSLTAGKAGEIDGDRFLGTLDQLKAYVKP
jgi:GH25 family lysozyme M1 (1,4-beta-N-acetylmuramidase)